MLMNRIGPSSAEVRLANADGADKRALTDSLWEDAMAFHVPVKVH